MWVLIVDRKRKGIRVYGIFHDPADADKLAEQMGLDEWTVLPVSIPPRFEHGKRIDIAEI